MRRLQGSRRTVPNCRRQHNHIRLNVPHSEFTKRLAITILDFKNIADDWFAYVFQATSKNCFIADKAIN